MERQRNEQRQKKKMQRKNQGVRGRGGERMSKQARKGEREVPTEQWLLSEFICALASQVNPPNGSK